MANDLELDGMPERMHRVRYQYKVETRARFEDRAPDLGEPIAYPDLTIGFVTRVTHGTDKDGDLYTVVVSELEPEQ